MAKYKYKGPAMLVGRFGPLTPGDVVDLWPDEIAFIEEQRKDTWECLNGENLQGVGIIVPALTPFGNLAIYNWRRDLPGCLKRLTRSDVMAVVRGMHSLGCAVPPAAELVSLSKEHLVQMAYAEALRLNWNKLDPSASPKPTDRPKSTLPVITKPEGVAIRADDPTTEEKEEAPEAKPATKASKRLPRKRH